MPLVLVLERQEGPSWVQEQPGLRHDLETSEQDQFYRNIQRSHFLKKKKLALKIWQYYVGNVNLVTVRNFIKKTGTYLRLGLHGTSGKS